MRVVLLAQKSFYTDIVIQRFLSLPDTEINGIIFSNTLLYGKSTLESLRTVLRKGGLGVFFGKFLDTLFARAPYRQYPCPVFQSKNVNSPEDVQKIASLKPDVIFSVFFNQIVKGPLLTLAPKGIVNIHPAYLPKYRGIGPTFWALADGETELGVTYHFISKGVDTGDIIVREKVEIKDDDSVHSLYARCSCKAAEMLPGVVRSLDAKFYKRIPQEEKEASYFGLPDKEGYRKLRSRGKSFITLRDIKNLMTQS